MSNFENSKKFQFRKFVEFAILKFQKLSIWKIRQIRYLENSKKFAVSKIPKISNLENSKKF